MSRSEMSRIEWSERACLVRDQPGDLRELVIDGTFADVVEAFGRFRVVNWESLTISFPDRQKPPFRYHEADFPRHVVSRLFEIGDRTRSNRAR